MSARKHLHKEDFAASPERIFSLLLTPSEIMQWWSAARAIVIPNQGGTWAAAWGDDEDDPDFVTVATIREFEPPRRLVLGNYRYHAKSSALPFEADFLTEFLVSPSSSGASLQVTQDGFPEGPEADEFYEACKVGWRDTFAGIRRLLDSQNEST